MKFPMARNALAEVRHNPRRIVAVVVAIMISVGYLVASVTILASESATMERSVIARTSNTDVAVTVAAPDTALVQQVRQVAGVKSADLSYLSRGRVTGSSEWVQQQSLPSNPVLRWASLAGGAWPAGPDEIALGTITAEQLNMRVGDEITINDANSSATLRITGRTHEAGSLLSGLAQSSFVAPEFYTGTTSIRRSLQTEILVIGDGSVAPDQLAGQIRSVAGGNNVETASAFAQRKMSEQAGGVFVFRLLLLVFGAIALLVGGILIVNTFLILVAQRRRQIGLLRAVGASSTQIRRSLLAEALTIGVLGSVLGVALGVGVSAVGAAVIGMELTVPVGQVAAVVAVGVVVAVLSVLVPARRATRISPLDALRSVADRQTERRSSVLRVVVSVVLMLGGLASIWIGSTESPFALLFSVGGEFVFAVGLLLAAGTYLPWLLRTLGALLGRFGPTARLAASNTVRNPGRAAATGAALVLAVGLVVTLQVGAASMKATANNNLDIRFPVDVTVSMFDGPLPAQTESAIAAIPGVSTTSKLKSTRATADLGPTKPDLRVLGAGDATDKILADPYLLTNSGTARGTTVTLVGKTGTLTLPIVPDYLAPADTLIPHRRSSGCPGRSSRVHPPQSTCRL